MTPTARLTLDDILDRFFLEHDAPTPEALNALLKRHPDHSDAIVAFTTAWFEQRLLPAETPVAEADERLLVDRACALFDIAAAEREAANAAAAPRQQGVSTVVSSLFELAQRAGLGLVDLAPLLDLDVGLVAKLDRRAIRPETLPGRLFSAIARVVGCSVREIQEALTMPPVQAVPSFLIVRSGPASRLESFADAVKASALPEDAKARWLADTP